jgi:hypothetical protein
MFLPDEEFSMLGEDELALLTRRFERMHENRVTHKEEHEDMLPVRQAGTLRLRLPGESQEQGQLQAQVEDGWQVPVEVRPQEQAQGQVQGRAMIQEEGEPRQGLR